MSPKLSAVEESDAWGKERIVKAVAAEGPPSGAGLVTVTCEVPLAATSDDGTAAVNCVELTYVVDRAAPFQLKTLPWMKPVPVAIRVNAALPATADVGEIDCSAGTGFPMVRVRVDDVPPPGDGLLTTICAVPMALIADIGIAAAS